VVEIEFDSLFERKFGETFVVIVLLEDDDVGFGEGFDDAAGDGGLAGAGASADSDD
jgi:hypothetical protein